MISFFLHSINDEIVKNKEVPKNINEIININNAIIKGSTPYINENVEQNKTRQ